MKWKVVIVGPTGTVYTGTNAFNLLYAFPSKEEAEEHAACFNKAGVKLALCDSENKYGIADQTATIPASG